MIWIQNIYDLQYYHSNQSQYCYCDYITFPTDLTLQAVISKITASSQCKIYAYSTDGVTQLGDVTAAFDWYTMARSGKYYWICRLREIFGLCTYKCFILRVVITEGTATIWDKFTEQYCITSCCLPVTQIRYTQPGFSTITLNASGSVNLYGNNGCGQMYALAGIANCYSAFTGYLYATGNKISGNADPFGFYDFGNIKGSLRKLPREIIRTISRNCRTQEVERTQKWVFESEEHFPMWKKEDIENWLSNDRFLINNKEYVVRSQTPFERIGRAFNDQKYERYKLRLELEECRQFQMIGCSEPCITTEATTYAFVVPVQEATYYDESGNIAAVGNDDLLTYLRSLNDTIAAEQVFLSPVNSQWDILTVSGTGYLPSAIYVNSFDYANKIPAIVIPTTDFDYGTLIPIVPCDSVIITAITSEVMVCGSITITAISSEDIPTTSANLIPYQGWIVNTSNTIIEKWTNTAKLNIDITNSAYPIGSISPYVVPNLSGEIIGVLPDGYRPQVAQTYDRNDYAFLPVGANIVFDPNGYIFYNGPVSSADETGSTIVLINIIYYL